MKFQQYQNTSVASSAHYGNTILKSNFFGLLFLIVTIILFTTISSTSKLFAQAKGNNAISAYMGMAKGTGDIKSKDGDMTYGISQWLAVNDMLSFGIGLHYTKYELQNETTGIGYIKDLTIEPTVNLFYDFGGLFAYVSAGYGYHSLNPYTYKSGVSVELEGKFATAFQAGLSVPIGNNLYFGAIIRHTILKDVNYESNGYNIKTERERGVEEKVDLSSNVLAANVLMRF